MKKVAIIGVGLMGGSLGMALRNIKKNSLRKYEILGIGRNIESLRLAKAKGAVDRYSSDIKDIAGSDIAVICLPVDMVAGAYKEAAKYLSKEAVVTDIGSVKFNIETKINEFKKNKSYPDFVGCHPMAGTEQSGIKSAKKNLYDNARVIITGRNGKSTKAVAGMWKDVGCEIVYMTAKEHDEIVAFTSHLPHIIAFSFYNMFLTKHKKNGNVDKVKAGSFESITRVAKSSPDIWIPIFLNNKKNLITLTEEFCSLLKLFVKQIDNKKSLEKILRKSIKNENK